LYRNEFCDLVEISFLTFNISFISRNSNQLEDSFDGEASSFKGPLNIKLVHEIQMAHRSSIPGNINHWKVVEDD
jgi:hypothetical protein